MTSVLEDIRTEFAERLDRLAKPASERYQGENGIVRFVEEVLGVTPTVYQAEILRAFVRHRRVAARGPHGLGKSALASWCVLWVMSVFETDVKVVTTASAWRQLEKYLWPEIHKWALKADWSKVGLQIRPGKELYQLSLRLPGKEAFAAASDNPELIEGAHAETIAYVFDEAKAIPPDTWDAAEGAFSQEGLVGKRAFAIAISTPGSPEGRFYEIHAKKPGLQDWWTRHVTLEEAMDAGQISAVWAENRRLQWGEESPVYKTRVLGEFASSDEDSVIPLEWVELAHQRWLECNGNGAPGREGYGCDVARFGEDKTVLAHMVGWVVHSVRYFTRQDTMKTVGYIAMEASKDTPIGVDVVGIGAGVVDRLLEQDFKHIVSINAGAKTDLKDITGKLRFFNLRSFIWWMLRDHLNPINRHYGLLALPPDDDKLTGDLIAPKWGPMSSGVIRVEGKDEIRKRLGHSTDSADAVGNALYALYYARRGGGGNLR